MSLNTCTISSNLGKAAELRYTNSQLAVVSFSVAVNERRKQADGSYQDEVNWLDCTMFGKRAEALNPAIPDLEAMGFLDLLRAWRRARKRKGKQ